MVREFCCAVFFAGMTFQLSTFREYSFHKTVTFWVVCYKYSAQQVVVGVFLHIYIHVIARTKNTPPQISGGSVRTHRRQMKKKTKRQLVPSAIFLHQPEGRRPQFEYYIYTSRTIKYSSLEASTIECQRSVLRGR